MKYRVISEHAHRKSNEFLSGLAVIHSKKFPCSVPGSQRGIHFVRKSHEIAIKAQVNDASCDTLYAAPDSMAIDSLVQTL